MFKKLTVPRGTKDILPTDILPWQDVETKSREILNTFGYQEIRTPIFEETGLFKRSLGQASEVVTKQLLALASEREDGFALRPEGTASIVRSYIENSIHRNEPISKYYYIGPMFRGERPQKGRLRQFHQIGVEAIGPGAFHPYLDAETIALSVKLLKSFGVDKFKLVINTLGSAQDKAKFAEYLKKEIKPKLSTLSEEQQASFNENAFRILDSKDKKSQDIVNSLDLDLSYLSNDSLNHYTQVKKALDTMGIKYEESPKLVRGLDYYNHTVYEIKTKELGSQDALGAGGRYDGLIHQLGGDAKVNFGALGFALGIERIMLVRKKRDDKTKEGLKVFIVTLDEECFSKGFEILTFLRENSIASDISYSTASLKAQMRQANKTGASTVFILGADEIKKGVVSIKDMTQGTQREEMIDHLEGIIANV